MLFSLETNRDYKRQAILNSCISRITSKVLNLKEINNVIAWCDNQKRMKLCQGVCIGKLSDVF